MKIILLIILSFTPLIISLDNGLGKTPPLGWNSWNHFACKVTEDIVKKAADALVSTGLKRSGYKYVNIDDCWAKQRDENGKLIADKEAFPNGIKALSDYIHSKGLLFGLYADAGTKTCHDRPGSLGFEEIDALTFVEWGVDYLKYDNCNNQGIDAKTRFIKMRDAIIKTGAKIYYSISNDGEENVATWGEPVGNSWRTTSNISDSYASFIEILDKQYGLEIYAGPGHWNDPDALEVGNGGMTKIESQAHFVLWAILKAPLLLSCDLTTLDQENIDLLTNYDILSVNQDKLGKQAKRVARLESETGYLDTYAGELKSNTLVVAFHNRSDIKQKMSVTFSDIGFDVPGGNIRNLLTGEDYGYVKEKFEAEVESHGIYVFNLHQYCLKNQDESLPKLKFLK